MRKELDTFKHC